MIHRQRRRLQSVAIVCYPIVVVFQLIVVLFLSISVGIEVLVILGSTSPVNERLHCPDRDGGEASRLVKNVKVAEEHR